MFHTPINLQDNSEKMSDNNESQEQPQEQQQEQVKGEGEYNPIQTDRMTTTNCTSL